MDAIEALTTRASAFRLVDPAPPRDAVDAALAAAARAPDHGRLRPWRFLIVRGDARARLGDVLADALRARTPGAADGFYEKEREKPLRAPLILVVAARVTPDHPKIPVAEQIASAVCAAHAALLAFHAKGYGTMWKTGPATEDPAVKAALGLAPADSIVGFLYAGTAAPSDGPPVRRPDPADHVVEWQGPA